MSGVVLAAASGQRMSTAKPDEEFKGGAARRRRSPSASSRAATSWRCLPRSTTTTSKTPHTVDITTTVVSRGRARRLHERRRAASRASCRASRAATGTPARFSTEDFAPGTYLLTVEAKSRAGKKPPTARAACSSGCADERAAAGAGAGPARGVGAWPTGVVGERRAGLARRAGSPGRPVPRDAVDDGLRHGVSARGRRVGGELSPCWWIVGPGFFLLQRAGADRAGRRRSSCGPSASWQVSRGVDFHLPWAGDRRGAAGSATGSDAAKDGHVT